MLRTKPNLLSTLSVLLKLFRILARIEGKIDHMTQTVDDLVAAEAVLATAITGVAGRYAALQEQLRVAEAAGDVTGVETVTAKLSEMTAALNAIGVSPPV